LNSEGIFLPYEVVSQQMPLSIVSIVNSRWAGQSRKVFSKTPQRQDLLQSSTSPRPAMEPCHLNNHWVLEVKQPGREDYHSSAEFRIARSYISNPCMPPGLAQGKFHLSPLRKLLWTSAVFHLSLSLTDVLYRIHKTVHVQYSVSHWYTLIFLHYGKAAIHGASTDEQRVLCFNVMFNSGKRTKSHYVHLGLLNYLFSKERLKCKVLPLHAQRHMGENR